MSYVDYTDEDEFDEREARRLAALEELRAEVIEYADNDKEHGWLSVTTDEGFTCKFPKRALIHHVFDRMHPMADLIPPYKAFSPSGVKLQMDDPFHTDLWLGAGFDIDEAYKHGSDKTDALHDAIRMIEDEYREKMTFDFTILANGFEHKDITHFSAEVFEYDGPLRKGVWSSRHIDCADKPKNRHSTARCIVIPRASVEFQIMCTNADVIITEVGGSLAHMAIVSREQGKLLLRIDDAIKRFPPWSKFWIDLNDLSLKVY